MEKIRDPTNVDYSVRVDSSKENTEDFVGYWSGYEYEFDYGEGYFSLGGYAEYLSIDPFIY